MGEPVKIAAQAKAPKALKAKKPAAKPSHPPTAQLVNSAIKALNERSGSSLQAIKKYIASNNKVDADKLSPFIKKYLKTAVVGKKLIQTKGKGASGSFKLSAASAKPPKGKKPAKKAASKAKKPSAKKPKVAGAKKPKAAKAKKNPAAKKASKPKSAAPKQKAVKASSKATKPKAPKVKAIKKPVTAAKKAAPKAK